MNDSVIKVENLSKRYRIGNAKESYKTIRETIVDVTKAPFWRLRAALGVKKSLSSPTRDNHIWALKDVSFDVKQGEVVGIIGRNGAGKSTLLKILSRITEPTEGMIKLRGRVGSLLEVGTGFHPELTGHENVYMYGAILGMNRWEVTRKFDEIVAFAELEEFIETPVKRYSSGMYMRLAFAVAAHMETEILLVDEVIAVGDAAFQKKCLGKMGEVSKGGRTVLFVSHNMAAIQALCESSLLLEKGRLKKVGKSRDIISEYVKDQTINTLYKNMKELPFPKGFNGKRSFKFEKIEVINSSATNMGPRTGDPLTIRMFYRADSEFISPAFMVSIKSYLGQEIIRLSTMPISGYRIDRLFQKGVVELSIKSLSLVSGRYLIDIGFARENIEWIEKLENIFEFEVVGFDIYKSGLVLDQTRGLIIMQHCWEHKIVG